MKKTHYICWWQKATTIIIIIIIIYIHYIFYFNFNSVHGRTHNWVLMGNNERRQSDSSTDVDQMLAGIERHCVFPARFHWFFSANGSSTKKKKKLLTSLYLVSYVYSSGMMFCSICFSVHHQGLKLLSSGFCERFPWTRHYWGF